MSVKITVGEGAKDNVAQYVVDEFEAAARYLEFTEVMSPADAQAAQRRYRRAKESLYALLGLVPPQDDA